MLERKTVSIQGQLLSYLSHAEGTRGNILFLHGWRSSASVWQAALEAQLQNGYSAYALDLPGFGSSANPKRAFSVGDYANIVFAFMEKLGISSAAVVGHSFGGRIGIVLSAEHASQVSKLVLVDSAGVRNPSPLRALIGSLAKLAKPLFAHPAMKRVRNKAYEALGADDYLATPELQETFKRVIAEDLQPHLLRISQETLLVWGENDADTPLSYAHTMQKAIPRARLEVIPNAGHFSFLDAPEKFTELLNSFLA